MRVTLGMFSPSGEPIPHELTIGREILVPLGAPEFEAMYFMADVLLDPVEDSVRLDMSITLEQACALREQMKTPAGSFSAEIVGSIEMDGSFRFLAEHPYTMEFIWGNPEMAPGLILVRYPAEIILRSGTTRYESIVNMPEFVAATEALINTSRNHAG